MHNKLVVTLHVKVIYSQRYSSDAANKFEWTYANDLAQIIYGASEISELRLHADARYKLERKRDVSLEDCDNEREYH